MLGRTRSGIFLAGAFILAFAAIGVNSGVLRMAQDGSDRGFVTAAAAPPAPTLSAPDETSVLLRVNQGENGMDTDYAVYVVTLGKWVDPYTKTASASSKIWARASGAWNIAGDGIRVIGLSPNTSYSFSVMARNIALDETDLGPIASIATDRNTNINGSLNVNENINIPPVVTNTNVNLNTNANVNKPKIKINWDFILNANKNLNSTAPPIDSNIPVDSGAAINAGSSTTIDQLGGQTYSSSDLASAIGELLGGGQPVYEYLSSISAPASSATVSNFDPPKITDVRLMNSTATAADRDLRDIVLEIHGTSAPGTRTIVFTLNSAVRTQTYKVAMSPWVITWPVAALDSGSHILRVHAVNNESQSSAISSPLSFDVPSRSAGADTSLVGVKTHDCSDNIDNDNDGLADYPNDNDCDSPEDTSEQGNTIGAIQRVFMPFQGFEDAAAVAAIRSIIDDPRVEIVTRRAVVPVMTTAALVSTVAAAGPSLILYLQYLLTIPLGLLFRRRRDRWGLVYNSLTKKSVELAMVRLIDAATGRIVQTRVTDKDGRFLFLVKPGSYRLIVQKNGIVFPSAILRSAANDGRFLEVYHGTEVRAGGTGVSIIAPNVPVDPVEAPRSTLRSLSFGHSLRSLAAYVPLLGLISGAFSFVIVPTGFLLALFIGNILIYLLAMRFLGRKKPLTYGLVYDAVDKKPIANAIIRLYDANYHKQLETQVTDRNGRYAFLVGPNVYEITAESVKYKTKIIDKIDLRRKKTAIIDVKIGLDRVGDK